MGCIAVELVLKYDETALKAAQNLCFPVISMEPLTAYVEQSQSHERTFFLWSFALNTALIKFYQSTLKKC